MAKVIQLIFYAESRISAARNLPDTSIPPWLVSFFFQIYFFKLKTNIDCQV